MKPKLTVRDFDARLELVDGERAVIATINTDSVDRYHTVILPAGVDLANYRKNPVVLAHHEGRSIPIGRNQWIKNTGKALVAKTVFLPEGIDADADKIFRLYQLGFLNAWSVGMNPTEWGKPTPEEIRARPEWAAAEIIYRRWELLEYSAVTTPGNAEAITQACSRGLALPGWPTPTPTPATTPAPALPPLRGRTAEQVMEAIRRQVRSEARGELERAMRDAEELARGMV